jgi:protein ImuB
VVETVELPEASGGPQLDYALNLLVRRLLARSDRQARTIRSVALQVSLEGAGTWCREVCFREATDDPGRMLLALAPVILGVTGPPRQVSIVITGFGPAAADQGSLIKEPAKRRRERLGEAVRQARAAAGPDAALRAVEVESDSRLPERRVALAPFEP